MNPPCAKHTPAIGGNFVRNRTPSTIATHKRERVEASGRMPPAAPALVRGVRLRTQRLATGPIHARAHAPVEPTSPPAPSSHRPAPPAAQCTLSDIKRPRTHPIHARTSSPDPLTRGTTAPPPHVFVAAVSPTSSAPRTRQVQARDGFASRNAAVVEAAALPTSTTRSLWRSSSALDTRTNQRRASSSRKMFSRYVVGSMQADPEHGEEKGSASPALPGVYPPASGSSTSSTRSRTRSSKRATITSGGIASLVLRSLPTPAPTGGRLGHRAAPHLCIPPAHSTNDAIYDAHLHPVAAQSTHSRAHRARPPRSRLRRGGEIQLVRKSTYATNVHGRVTRRRDDCSIPRAATHSRLGRPHRPPSRTSSAGQRDTTSSQSGTTETTPVIGQCRRRRYRSRHPAPPQAKALRSDHNSPATPPSGEDDGDEAAALHAQAPERGIESATRIETSVGKASQ
ncbi:hypothetical protein C8R46DRAFT_1362844 [Mycena filopes]|nr:hypothetical protein C8R46DRAFT_1362844 [Mycena filopes]